MCAYVSIYFSVVYFIVRSRQKRAILILRSSRTSYLDEPSKKSAHSFRWVLLANVKLYSDVFMFILRNSLTPYLASE